MSNLFVVKTINGRKVLVPVKDLYRVKSGHK